MLKPLRAKLEEKQPAMYPFCSYPIGQDSHVVNPRSKGGQAVCFAGWPYASLQLYHYEKWENRFQGTTSRLQRAHSGLRPWRGRGL